MSSPDAIDDIATPALIVEHSHFQRNVELMAKERPGSSCRPHVKAFKSTALARELQKAGHNSFCAATTCELEGLVAAGIVDDLLLANETYDYSRLGRLVESGADITVAVDSSEVLQAVIQGGVKQVLIDVDVGLPRCGCDEAEAPRLAETARSAGLRVRGVMGYEGHLMMTADESERRDQVEESMATLLRAHDKVGGEVISAGGTGTYRVNEWANEIQAGSYLLMDTQYDTLELPFEIALTVMGRVISVSNKGWVVADVGIKSLGMDHGDPIWPGGEVLFCSDEHVTLIPSKGRPVPKIGDLVQIQTAHIDPTVSKHRDMWVVDGEKVIDQWPVDLRYW